MASGASRGSSNNNNNIRHHYHDTKNNRLSTRAQTLVACILLLPALATRPADSADLAGPKWPALTSNGSSGHEPAALELAAGAKSYRERRNFGRRLLAAGSAGSLLARTIRHLNGSPASNLTSFSGRNRETSSQALVSGSPTTKSARPNLPLETWARLINRNVNVSSQLRSQPATPTGPLTPGALRRAATPTRRPTAQVLADSAQETLSIGIVIRPGGGGPNGTSVTAATSGELVASQIEPSAIESADPDWEASNDIEQVIQVDKQQVTASGSGYSSGDTSAAHKQQAAVGERLKAKEQSGHWSSSDGGAHQLEGSAGGSAKMADRALVDLGHHKHGWKNVYHKEEYAQHQKYHDVFRDRDWHDKRSRQAEQHQLEKGAKFNKSLASNFRDANKQGTKYDFRKGSEWRRSEDENELQADGEADSELDDQHSDFGKTGASQVSDKYMAPKQRAGQEEGAEDELILEQMRARLEDLSERANGQAPVVNSTAREPHEMGSRMREWPPEPKTMATHTVGHQSINDILKTARRAKGNRSSSSSSAAGGRHEPSRASDGIDLSRPLRVQNGRRRQQTEADSSDHSRDDGDDDGNNDDDDDDGGDSGDNAGNRGRYEYLAPVGDRDKRQPIGQMASASALTTRSDETTGGDKRNELRLKLELDLGKSLGGGGSTQELTKLANTTSSWLEDHQNHTSVGFTNSLGHGIGASRPTNGSHSVGGLAQGRLPAHRPSYLFANASGHHSNSQSANRKPALGSGAHPATRLSSGWGAKGRASAANSSAALSEVLPNRPIFVKHLQMNGGVVLGKLDGPLPTNHSPAVGLLEDSFALSPEDLRIENSLGGHLEDDADGADHHHELGLVGRPTLADEPPSKDYVVVFGGFSTDHSSAADSSRSQGAAAHLGQVAPPERLLAPEGPSDEPNVIFEASASTLHDDRLPAHYFRHFEAQPLNGGDNDELHVSSNDLRALASTSDLTSSQAAAAATLPGRQQVVAELAAIPLQPLRPTVSWRQHVGSHLPNLLRAATLGYASSDPPSQVHQLLNRWLRLPRVFEPSPRQRAPLEQSSQQQTFEGQAHPLAALETSPPQVSFQGLRPLLGGPLGQSEGFYHHHHQQLVGDSFEGESFAQMIVAAPRVAAQQVPLVLELAGDLMSEPSTRLVAHSTGQPTGSPSKVRSDQARQQQQLQRQQQVSLKSPGGASAARPKQRGRPPGGKRKMEGGKKARRRQRARGEVRQGGRNLTSGGDLMVAASEQPVKLRAASQPVARPLSATGGGGPPVASRQIKWPKSSSYPMGSNWIPRTILQHSNSSTKSTSLSSRDIRLPGGSSNKGSFGQRIIDSFKLKLNGVAG